MGILRKPQIERNGLWCWYSAIVISQKNCGLLKGKKIVRKYSNWKVCLVQFVIDSKLTAYWVVLMRVFFGADLFAIYFKRYRSFLVTPNNIRFTPISLEIECFSLILALIFHSKFKLSHMKNIKFSKIEHCW